MKARCPICGVEIPRDTERRLRPFCSSRCRMVDLDRWLSGDYRIEGPPIPREAEVPDTTEISERPET